MFTHRYGRFVSKFGEKCHVRYIRGKGESGTSPGPSPTISALTISEASWARLVKSHETPRQERWWNRKGLRHEEGACQYARPTARPTWVPRYLPGTVICSLGILEEKEKEPGAPLTRMCNTVVQARSGPVCKGAHDQTTLRMVRAFTKIYVPQ